VSMSARSQRADPHRPSAIIPTDYTHVLSYGRIRVQMSYQAAPGCPVQTCWKEFTFRQDCESKDDARFGVGHDTSGRCCVARLMATSSFFSIGNQSHCSICGAWFKSGSIWKHKVSGEHIFVGHTCATKYRMLYDRSEWQAWQKARQQERSQAAREQVWATARAKRREENPELFERLAKLAAHEGSSEFAKHFATDLSARIDRWGLPSEAQLALLSKLEGEAINGQRIRLERAEEKHVPAPQGRIEFSGEVLSVKLHESDFGSVYKMTVKVVTPEGSWLAWLTVPSGAYWNVDENGGGSRARNDVRELKGQKITVRATLSRSDRDEHFAFGKRPTLIAIDGQEHAKPLPFVGTPIFGAGA